jgi:hypothetical protein
MRVRASDALAVDHKVSVARLLNAIQYLSPNLEQACSANLQRFCIDWLDQKVGSSTVSPRRETSPIARIHPFEVGKVS